MKWKEPMEFLSEKTFLVVKDEENGGVILQGKGRASPRARSKTSTWPPKVKKGVSFDEAVGRPKTANLERPSVLDPNLVDKLDMSLLSKELLCDSMTRIQCGPTGGGLSTRRRQSVPVGERHRSVSTAAAASGAAKKTSNSGLLSLARQKRQSFEPLTDSELCHDVDVMPNPPSMKKHARLSTAASTSLKDNPVRRFGSEIKRLDANNNKNGITPSGRISSLSTVKKRSGSKATLPSDVEVFTSAPAKNAPEPCKTCGRPDQPERFHSHPKGGVPSKFSRSREDTAATSVKSKSSVPKTVQKPIALNFRSEKSKRNVDTDEDTRAVAKNRKPVVGERGYRVLATTMAMTTKRGPKTVTCYICSREFGTASFPIHEPKCMQKWERENNALPASQRRSPPQRPSVSIDHHDWNTAAWEQSQEQLVPCPRCARTFLPDRLLVHQRSCKATPKNGERSEKIEPAENAIVPPGRRTVTCRVCGRNFSTRSIKIHEPQCLKRRQNGDEALPTNERKREEIPVAQENFSVKSSRDVLQQKRTVTCYICGRDFGSTSIAIHEPQCIKKWHAENDKLPPNQRRKEPQKPDIVFTRDPTTGAAVVDYSATAEASWRSHLGQLVPCKRCGRTFNPDRVAVHERSCKGTPDGDCDFLATFHRIWENHLNSLVPCRKCERTFTETALGKHEPHCDGSYRRKSTLRKRRDAGRVTTAPAATNTSSYRPIKKECGLSMGFH